MPDDARPPTWVPIEPIAPGAVATPPPPGWYPDGTGNNRWWDGRQWTDHIGPRSGVNRVAPVLPAVMPATTAPGGRRGWWIGGGVAAAALLVVSAIVIGTVMGPDLARSARRAALPAGTADYYTFTGPLGRPMAVGAPWGPGCAPVVLNVEDSVPDAVYAEVVHVVTEARASGIAIGVESRQHTWQPGDLPVPGPRTLPVQFVAIFADTDAGHLRSDGKPERDRTGWDAVADPNGQTEHLTRLSMTLHLATLGDSRLEYRRALRKLVGWSQGIADSTSPNSALPDRATDSPDAFSPADIAAMKVMSGCSGS